MNLFSSESGQRYAFFEYNFAHIDSKNKFWGWFRFLLARIHLLIRNSRPAYLIDLKWYYLDSGDLAGYFGYPEAPKNPCNKEIEFVMRLPQKCARKKNPQAQWPLTFVWWFTRSIMTIMSNNGLVTNFFGFWAILELIFLDYIHKFAYNT